MPHIHLVDGSTFYHRMRRKGTASLIKPLSPEFFTGPCSCPASYAESSFISKFCGESSEKDRALSIRSGPMLRPASYLPGRAHSSISPTYWARQMRSAHVLPTSEIIVLLLAQLTWEKRPTTSIVNVLLPSSQPTNVEPRNYQINCPLNPCVSMNILETWHWPPTTLLNFLNNFNQPLIHHQWLLTPIRPHSNPSN